MLLSMPKPILRHIGEFVDYQYCYFLFNQVEWYDQENVLHIEKICLQLDKEIEKFPREVYAEIDFTRHMFQVGYGYPTQPWTFGMKYNSHLPIPETENYVSFQFINTIWLVKRDLRNKDTWEQTFLCTDEYIETDVQYMMVDDNIRIEFDLQPGNITRFENIKWFIWKDYATQDWVNRVLLCRESPIA